MLFRIYLAKINEKKNQISWLRFGHATELLLMWFLKKNPKKITFILMILQILKSLAPFTGKLMQSSKSCQSPEFYGTRQVELVYKGTEYYTHSMPKGPSAPDY